MNQPSSDELKLSATARTVFARATTAEVILPLVGPKGPISPQVRYELRELIAQGTFGVVHVALDRSNGRLVALKILQPTVEPQAIIRFEREASAARRLDHPAIVRLLDVGKLENLPFISFELIKGRSLKAHVEDRGPLGEKDAIALVRRLAEALAHAHDRGVIHRDVSPSNVILGERGPVLADFGLAKDLLAADALTRTGDVLGTLRFMAPEVLEGRAHQCDERADVFGLGAVLHFSLTGEAPFAAKSVTDLADEMRRGYRAPESLPKRPRRMAGRLLATDPRERPRSAADVIALCDTESIETGWGKLTDTEPPVAEAPLPASSPHEVGGGREGGPEGGPEGGRGRSWMKLLLIPVVLAVLAAALFFLLPRDSKTEALALLADADGRSPLEQQTAAARALGLVPGLPEAYALRARAAAQSGDLAKADEDLARAGTGELARRARAWSLFRANKVADALSLVAGTRDEARLRWSNGDLAAPPAELAALPRFVGEMALRRGDFVAARRELERAAEPGSLDGCEALLLLARLDHLDLDDEGARRGLRRALAAPPREASLARALSAKLERIESGAPLGDGARDGLDVALALGAREVSREELERHRLTGAAPDLRRATQRLERVVLLAPGDESARSLLERALSRQVNGSKERLRALLPSLPPLAAAHALHALGDLGGAEIALGRALDPGPREAARLADLRIVLARDGDAACKRFRFEAANKSDLEVALKALDRLVLDDPSAAIEELEYMVKGGATLELAQARAAHDPAGSLAALLRGWRTPPSGEALVLLEVLARAFEQKDVPSLLATRGLTPDEAKRAASLIGPGRAALSELGCPPTLDGVAAVVAKGEADPLRLYRDPRLVPLRAEPRWAELVRAAER